MSTGQKMSIIFLVIVLLNVAGSDKQVSAQNRPGLSLKETFDLYVQSVQHSDLEMLFTTITDSDKFLFLTADGKLIDSRQGYYQFHQDWFKETGWEMPVEFLEIHEGKEYGYTLALFHFKGKTPDRASYYLDSYFTLIFHREHDMWKVVADICTPTGRYFSDENSEVKYSAEQMYLLNIIKNRRTVRKFKSTPVPEEHIMKILAAAHFAPTAGNQQPWKFLVIRDRHKLDQLKEAALGWYLEGYKNRQRPGQKELQSVRKTISDVLEKVLSAPVYVAVLVDSRSKYPKYIIYDGTLAAGYLMIAARALGYGTGFFTTFFPGDRMKEFFKIPERYKLICFTPIGVPEKFPDMPPKKALSDIVVFEEFK